MTADRAQQLAVSVEAAALQKSNSKNDYLQAITAKAREFEAKAKAMTNTRRPAQQQPQSVQDQSATNQLLTNALASGSLANSVNIQNALGNAGLLNFNNSTNPAVNLSNMHNPPASMLSSALQQAMQNIASGNLAHQQKLTQQLSLMNAANNTLSNSNFNINNMMLNNQATRSGLSNSLMTSSNVSTNAALSFSNASTNNPSQSLPTAQSATINPNLAVNKKSMPAATLSAASLSAMQSTGLGLSMGNNQQLSLDSVNTGSTQRSLPGNLQNMITNKDIRMEIIDGQQNVSFPSYNMKFPVLDKLTDADKLDATKPALVKANTLIVQALQIMRSTPGMTEPTGLIQKINRLRVSNAATPWAESKSSSPINSRSPANNNSSVNVTADGRLGVAAITEKQTSKTISKDLSVLRDERPCDYFLEQIQNLTKEMQNVDSVKETIRSSLGVILNRHLGRDIDQWDLGQTTHRYRLPSPAYFQDESNTSLEYWMTADPSVPSRMTDSVLPDGQLCVLGDGIPEHQRALLEKMLFENETSA